MTKKITTKVHCTTYNSEQNSYRIVRYQRSKNDKYKRKSNEKNYCMNDEKYIERKPNMINSNTQ